MLLFKEPTDVSVLVRRVRVCMYPDSNPSHPGGRRNERRPSVMFMSL